MLACLLLVAGGFLAAPSHAGIVYPPEQTFRFDAACSDLIVVGRVVASEEPTRSTSYSQVEIERCLVGSAEQGDTLVVSWRADFSMSEAGPQLNRLTGIRAMYFLQQRPDRLRLSPAYPLLLVPESRATLRTRLSWIRLDSPDDLLAKKLSDSWPVSVSPWPCNTDDSALLLSRLRIVAAYLEGYLDGLDVPQDGQDGSGRSN
jgi:hypothetical protein